MSTTTDRFNLNERKNITAEMISCIRSYEKVPPYNETFVGKYDFTNCECKIISINFGPLRSPYDDSHVSYEDSILCRRIEIMFIDWVECQDEKDSAYVNISIAVSPHINDPRVFYMNKQYDDLAMKLMNMDEKTYRCPALFYNAVAKK